MTPPSPSNHGDDQAPRSVARDARALPAVDRALPAVDRALADLADVAELVPLLALLRDPTAHRPWREVPLDAEARDELDHAARAEQRERTEDALGEHQDAARADVLDLLSGVLWRAEDLAHHLSRAAWCPVLRPAQADADPRPYLARAAGCLVAAVLGWPNGKDIAHFAADRTAALRADLEAALALVPDGHTVKAHCPWCHGGLTGAYTWRVRVLAGEPVIVCENPAGCEPPYRDAGTWWRGRPAWRLGDWAWLAARLWHLDRRAQAAAPNVARASVEGATGRAGAPLTAQAEAELLTGRLDRDVCPPPTTELTIRIQPDDSAIRAAVLRTITAHERRNQ